MKLKRIVCGLLTAVMLISSVSILASAKYSGGRNFENLYPELYLSEADRIYPTIIVPGINHSEYYLADENGNAVLKKDGGEYRSTLLLLNEEELTKEILKVVPSLLASIIFQKDLGVSKKLGGLVESVMKYMKMDDNGETVYNLITKTYNYPVSEMSQDEKSFFYRMLPVEPICDLYGEDKMFLYTFPLFGDPMQSAESLDNYIKEVQRTTGSRKVNLVSVSLGGTVLTAYLDSGKDYSKINKIINMVSLLGGTDIMADFIGRTFNLEDEFFYHEYFPMLLGGLAEDETLGYLVNIILRLFSRPMIESIFSNAYTGLHETVLRNNPQFWAMIPYDKYDEVAQKFLSGPEKALLKKKADRFHVAQGNLYKNMKKVADAGTKVYSICGYGLTYADGSYNYFSIAKSTKDTNGDGIIPVFSTSMGATAVRNGSRLSDSYIAGHDTSFISPDKELDASTCLFPYRTWFFYKQHHEIAYNDVAIRLVAMILGGKVDDIKSSELFPQFNYTRNTRKLLRCDSGYIWKADEALKNGTLSQENKTALQKSYDDCVNMINKTICNAEETDKCVADLVKTLSDTGVTEKAKKESDFLLNLLKALSTFNYKIFGRKGFFQLF